MQKIHSNDESQVLKGAVFPISRGKWLVFVILEPVEADLPVLFIMNGVSTEPDQCLVVHYLAIIFLSVKLIIVFFKTLKT